MQTSSRITAGRTQRRAYDASPKPKLLDQVRLAIRALLYSGWTHQTYDDWINGVFSSPAERQRSEMAEATSRLAKPLMNDSFTTAIPTSGSVLKFCWYSCPIVQY
jgi:hypothetical protein